MTIKPNNVQCAHDVLEPCTPEAHKATRKGSDANNQIVGTSCRQVVLQKRTMSG